MNNKLYYVTRTYSCTEWAKSRYTVCSIQFSKVCISTFAHSVYSHIYTVIPRLTSDPANDFFG